jgi:branched-chain amino acid transport system substrate-binding protein
MVRRYRKEYGEGDIAPHVSMGFNNLWILLNDVLPRAIQKYGGWSPDAISKAARETDIPAGGTMMGYGVKFFPPGHQFAGQNERAFPVVDEVINGEFQIVYPKGLTTVKPNVLLPRTSPLAIQ